MHFKMRLKTYVRLFEQFSEDWLRAHERIVDITSDLVRLANIFTKRFEELVRISPPKSSKFIYALNVILCIATDLFLKWGQTLLYLNNLNIGHTMTDFRRIISNRRWLQKNSQIPKEQFDINIKDFVFRQNEKIMKAIACGEYQIYSPDTNDSRWPVVNILKNEELGGIDLIYVYIIKLIHRLTNSEHYYILSSSLFEKLKLIFDEKMTQEIFDIHIAYMLNTKLIEYSILVEKNSPVGIILMPKSFELWRLLRKNTVLLEIYREDIWIDPTIRHSTGLTINLNKKDLFLDIISIVEFLFTRERDIILNVLDKGTLEQYVKFFGPILISKSLLTSIINSLRPLSEELQNDLIPKVHALANKINDFNEHLVKNYNLNKDSQQKN
jgi:hypothetical protein